MTSSDTLLARMMTLHPKIIDLTLDRVWDLLAKLGNPQDALPPVIHIAGTNGKGSTLAMFRAGIEGTGLRTHAYTSPHLARFHERIRLAGELICEEALTALLDECYRAQDGTPITYFEITTVAALLAFARTPADYTLLEVGLGGRLDATNVVARPALTAITPVAMDHEAFLGDTLGAIAGEKAGILKRGVTCIVGPQQEAAQEVIEDRAARIGAPLLSHGQDWHVWEERGRLVFQDAHGLMDLPLPALIGAHQVQNAGIVIAGLRHLARDGGAGGPRGLGDRAIEAALTDAVWPARMQRLRRGPLVERARPADVWLDGGHNPAAGYALAEALTRLPHKPLTVICGMLRTKDAAGFLSALKADHLYAVSIPDEAATLTAQETAAAARAAGLAATEAGDVASAVRMAQARAPDNRILICGSLYLAGHILRDHG